MPANHKPSRPQTGTKRIIVKAPAELPYLMMGYHAPTIRNVMEDWEPYALEILEGVLDGHASARLNKSLVRESQIANSARCGLQRDGARSKHFLSERGAAGR
jgi:zinc protease